MSTSTASWETRDVDVSLGDLKGRSFGKSPHTDPCDIVERFEVAMEVRKRDGVRFAPVVNGDHNPQTSPAAT